jgi:hypothetical protein
MTRAIRLAAVRAHLLGIAFLGTVFFGALFFCESAYAQSVPTKQEASDLIFQAGQQRFLTANGAPPFHLVAHFRYVVGTTAQTGTYELIWAEPERYREEFRLGDDVGETDLAMDGKLYVFHNTSYLTYQLWRIRSLMLLPVKPSWAKLEKERPVHSVKQDGPNLVTVELDSKPGRNRVQLDLATRKIVSEETSTDQGQIKKSSLSDDFEDFGATRYPRHILFTLRDQTMEINVTKLESADTFGDTVFVPPANATSRDWCADPQIQKRLPWAASTPVSPALLVTIQDFKWNAQNNGAHYVLIAADGLEEKMVRLYPDGKAEEIALGKNPKDRPVMPIMICGGKPIEFEYVTQELLMQP